MTTETIFQLINLYVLPFWLLMILAPHWRVTHNILRTLLPIVPLAGIYVLLLGMAIGGKSGGGGLDFSLAGISRLMADPFGFTVGWAHYLAFDLFVGRWIFWHAREASERKLPQWLISLTLALTFMAGPAGLLLYFLCSAHLPNIARKGHAD
ncbi:MAG TPA: ABA4-like family protein [Anaerolineales bacterium]|nr:ABA4-like family protein [Anaerolineales bacterium]